jgi:hypothetical protein
MSPKASWFGVALVVALLTFLGLRFLLDASGDWPEVVAAVVFLGTLIYGLSRP